MIKIPVLGKDKNRNPGKKIKSPNGTSEQSEKQKNTKTKKKNNKKKTRDFRGPGCARGLRPRVRTCSLDPQSPGGLGFFFLCLCFCFFFSRGVFEFGLIGKHETHIFRAFCNGETVIPGRTTHFAKAQRHVSHFSHSEKAAPRGNFL